MLGYSLNSHNCYGSAMLNPGSGRFFWVSHLGGRDPVTWAFLAVSAAFPSTIAGNWIEVEKSELEPAAIWDASITGSGSTCYITIVDPSLASVWKPLLLIFRHRLLIITILSRKMTVILLNYSCLTFKLFFPKLFIPFFQCAFHVFLLKFVVGFSFL